MNTNLKSIALFSAILTATPQTVFAGDWSVGVFAGQASTDDVADACNETARLADLGRILNPERFAIRCVASDDSDSAVGINLAYHFNDAWALEAGYVDLGAYSSTITVGRFSSDTVLEAKAPYLAAVSTYGLSDRFSASFRYGITKIDAEVSTSSSLLEASVDSDVGAYYGVSLGYDLSDVIELELRYDYFDIEVIGLGARFHF